MSAQLNKAQRDGWSPYLAGALVGLLAILSVYLTTTYMGKSNYLGASTTFVRAAGLVFQNFDAAHVAQNAYYAKEKVKIDWQFLLIIGIFFGALFSSVTDKSFKLEGVPPVWQQRFGPSVIKRAVFAFLGGIVAMIGARLYAELYPTLKSTVLSWGDFGKIGLPEALGVNHWIIAITFTVITLWLFRWFEKKGL